MFFIGRQNTLSGLAEKVGFGLTPYAELLKHCKINCY